MRLIRKPKQKKTVQRSRAAVQDCESRHPPPVTLQGMHTQEPRRAILCQIQALAPCSAAESCHWVSQKPLLTNQRAVSRAWRVNNFNESSQIIMKM